MADHPRCATCAHWCRDEALGYIWADRVRLDYQGPPVSGTCSKVGSGEGGGTAWLDGSDPQGAVLETRADHYCPMHSALSP